MPTVLITGSCSPIGSEAVPFYDRRTKRLIGVDNNLRADLFDSDGNTNWRRAELRASVLEAIDRIEQLPGRSMASTLCDRPRNGDHIRYYTNLIRFRTNYPEWKPTIGLGAIFEEFAVAVIGQARRSGERGCLGGRGAA